nr:reverse transcriptase domain-containing protein [Plastoroseomonas hellenica]
MRQVPDEPVRLYAQPKDKGGWRPIHVYGVQNHARQIILGWMIQPRVQLDPRQFALQGGVPAAIAAAKDQINHHNARWAVEVDFTNCFGTIDREWAVNRLRGLGVPEQVTRATAFPDDNYVRTPTSSDWLWSDRYLSLPGPLTLRSQARSGVPQGAACSSLIAEIAISDILSALQITDQVVVYADNVLLMAPTRRELERLADTLGSAALRGSAGRFALKRGKVRRVDWGFDYLGHRIHSYRGKAHVEPSRAAMEDCAKTIMKRMRDVVRGKPRALRRLRSFCRGWAAAFSMWSRVVENIRGALFRGAMLLGRAAVDRLRDIMACATRAAGTEQHAGSRS